MKKFVSAEVDEDGSALRIFRSRKLAAIFEAGGGRVLLLSKAEAVGAIRRKVFSRAENTCENCGEPVTEKTGHMDEKHAKGKRDAEGNFGEVSVENGQVLCPPCHIGPFGKHGDRKWNGRTVKP